MRIGMNKKNGIKHLNDKFVGGVLEGQLMESNFFFFNLFLIIRIL